MRIAEPKNEPTWAPREVVILKLPVPESQQIDHPEKLILMIDDKSFDVGSLCYGLRFAGPRFHSNPTLVDEDSLITSRRLIVQKLIRFCSILMVKKRPLTIVNILCDFKTFADFADGRGLGEIFDLGKNSERAFADFASYTFERHRLGHIGAERAQALQAHVLLCLKSLTENNHFASEVRLISLNHKRMRSETLPANQKELSHLLAMSQMIFRGLSDLVINHKPFPYKLSLPNSLGWSTGNYLWIFSTSIWFLHPENWGETREKLQTPNWPYDYENGRIHSCEDIWQFYKGSNGVKKRRARNSVSQAIELMETVNSNPMHERRLMFAKLAMKTFVLLFIVNTGVNPSVLSNIETEDKIDSNVVNQNYRAIKYRARGLILTVRVPTNLMPDLRRYMQLRKFILNGQSSTLLFFRFNVFNNIAENIKPLAREPIGDLFRILLNIDPKISPISPRTIRATINDWYLRNHDVHLVAKVMGHSEQVELTKYGRGSPITQQQEMTEYFLGVSQAARVQKISNSREPLSTEKVLMQGGSCTNFGNPMGMTNVPSIQPDCKSNCWYCVNRQLVADEIDARKIASAIFVMEQFVRFPVHEKVLRPLIRKCESDLELISKTRNSDSMVQKVKFEVFNKGRLAPYWAMKFHQFLELGIIV